jgi:PAS domain S-box-containing protein
LRYDKDFIRSKFKDLFEYSLDYIYVNDLKGNFLDANKIALDTLGYKEEEIESLNFLDVLADKDQLIKAMDITREIIQKGKQSERNTYKLKSKNGHVLFLETYGIPLKKNNEIYAIMGIGANITRRKLAEGRLKESEKRFRNLFQKSPFGIIILNFDGKIIESNPTTENLTGYESTDFIHKHFSQIPIIQTKDIPTLTSLFNKMVNGEHVNRIDVEIKRKDGNLIWINLQGSVVQLENDSFIQVIIQNISKRKEAELLINKELKTLHELDNTRKKLMIRISHELKTPLLLIMGAIEYLFESRLIDINHKAADIISTVIRASSRLEKLIENLIDATRINYNKLQLNKENTNLNNLVDESTEDIKFLIKKHQINLEKKYIENIILSLDELRIKQVITNILINALKNTPPHGIIRIILEKNDLHARLSIEDTGIGLTQKETSMLFTQFGKFERDEEELDFIDIQGSGLGLFISKAIIDLHGGQIWAESEGRNKGVRFIITLPLEDQ